MRPRMTTLLLALTGLLVAIAVGLVANAIASRSFTAGVDALPSAGSLAPPALGKRPVPAQPAPGSTAPGAAATTTTAKAAAGKPKPSAGVKPKPKLVTTTTSTAPAPAPVTTDDHGGSRKGKDSSGSPSGHGKHGGDD
jgi:hypothetical protein